MHNPCLLANKALLHAPTPAHTVHNARHLAHNCEGGRLGYAPKSLSGHNPCLRSPSQEGRRENIEAAGMEGACEPIRTFTTSARRVCSSKEGTIGSHLPNSSQEEHLRASNARACRAPLAPPASCHSRPGHITDLSRLRHILRIFCASKEHFCNYILICNYAAFLCAILTPSP